MSATSTFTPEQNRQMLDKIYPNGEWRELKQDISNYNKIRRELFHDIENQQDPLFRRNLEMYKSKLGATEYLHNRLKIYNICYQRAMQESRSDDAVDEIANDQTQAEVAISLNESSDHKDKK